MADSIKNFIELLTKGDFFLMFLIAMMLIIIGVIVYLVKLQIGDAPDYKRRDDDDEEDDDDFYEDFEANKKQELELTKKEIIKSPIKPEKEELVTNYESLKDIEDIQEDIEEIDNHVDNMISETLNDNEDIDDIINEPLYKDEDFESPAHPPRRFIEQSKFDFETNEEEFDERYEIEDEPLHYQNLDEKETLDTIKNYEDEQERTAIISASELESRINELKASGEYETHEKELEAYEQEQESKAIISYEELLERASTGVVSYESEEEIGGCIKVGKVDTSNIDSFKETNEKPYYKEDAFLEAMKEFRRAL